MVETNYVVTQEHPTQAMDLTFYFEGMVINLLETVGMLHDSIRKILSIKNDFMYAEKKLLSIEDISKKTTTTSMLSFDHLV